MDSHSPLVNWYLRWHWVRCTHDDAMARLNACLVALTVAAAFALG